MLSQELCQFVMDLLDTNNCLRKNYINRFDNRDAASLKYRIELATNNIPNIEEIDGNIAVNSQNFNILWTILRGIHAAYSDKYYRMWMFYKLLSRCTWVGLPVKFCATAATSIDEIKFPDELAYYIWWREEYKKKHILKCTRTHYWMYVRDLLHNTVFTSAEDSLDSLIFHYQQYSNLAATTDSFFYNKQKVKNLILNYALYNGLWNKAQQLIYKYGPVDNYEICKNISEGSYIGAGEYLIELAYSKVKTKAFVNSPLYQDVVNALPIVFKQLDEVCKNRWINVSTNLVGQEQTHVVWDVYDGIIYEGILHEIVPLSVHQNFSIGKNFYCCATQSFVSVEAEDDSTILQKHYSDRGEFFHKKGSYYCKKYTGAGTTGRELVSYVVRELQNHYRRLTGKEELAELHCPYFDIEADVKAIIAQLHPVNNTDLFTQSTNAMEFKLLNSIPEEYASKYKYLYDYKQNKIILSEDSRSKEDASMQIQMKIERIEKIFDSLKDTDLNEMDGDSEVYSITERAIAPMLSIDNKRGQQMWQYVLDRNYGNCHPVDFHVLTDHVIECAETGALIRVFKENKNIREYVYLLNPYENHLNGEWFIRDIVLRKEFELADQLLSLYIKNTHGDNNPQENLWNTLYSIVNSSDSKWEIDEEGIAFTEKWILRITSQKKRIQLDAALEELKECVIGDAPKGAMPLQLFLQKIDEGTALSEIVEERQKRETYKPQSKNSSSDANCSVAKERDGQKKVSAEKAGDCTASMDQLHTLVGLEKVKAEVEGLANLIKVRSLREKRGLKNPDMSLHLVFSGNPGTGKTTVARILANIYHSLGVLSKGHLVEVDRGGLVAGYIGQTAIKTQEVIDEALGGILFIDEAYALVPDETPNDFGIEAINTLLKAMEDHRDDFVVIVAGYSELMPKFIDSNPGLKSRFNKYILFDDYNGDELYRIFKGLLEKNDYHATQEVLDIMKEYLTSLYDHRDGNFGNARDVRNLFEKIIAKQANRIAGIEQIENIDITQITKEDIIGIIII